MVSLGYVYNRGAASLRTRRVDTIGVIVTNLGNPFFGELLQALTAEFEAAGYTCLLIGTRDDPRAQERAVAELREHQVAGMAIVPASGTDPQFIEALNSQQVRHVFMTRYLVDAATSYVGADDQHGGELAAQHLIGHGSRSFAYVGGRSTVRSRIDRMTGVGQVMAAHGMRPAELVDVPSETTGAGGFEAAERIISEGDVPEAILCHSDNVAFGVLRALRLHGAGDGVRVIGYDDIAAAALWEPPLTTVSTRGTELGQLAAKSLLAQIRGEETDAQIVMTEPTLTVRQSCGCPPSDPRLRL